MNRMATANPAVTQWETAHALLSAQIAAEGIVLLENNGVLPFGATVKNIALFGSGARRTVKGGTGSGDVNVRGFVTVEQGLADAGYRIVTSKWMDEYDNAVDSTRAVYDAGIKKITAEKGPFASLVAMMGKPFETPPFRPLTREELAAFPADAAVYVLSRNSGEGADRKTQPGDYYLSEQEIADITLLSETYARFVLLLNVGGVIDLSGVKCLPGVGAIVLMGQGGSGCGSAAAAVLSGKTTPSGKLAATWAADYCDYPFADEYAAVGGDIFDTYYKEGIYVGYRYFDTFGVQPAYPFGFGLSYTDYSIKVCAVSLDGNMVTLTANVTNTGGTYSGREVVQLYIGAPAGKLDKPQKALCAFAKTETLAPGQSQTLALSFTLQCIASYDENISAWALERGDYLLYCGNSSKNTNVAAIITVPKAIITEQCKKLFRGEKVETLVKEKAAPAPQGKGAFHLTVKVESITPVAHRYSTPPAVAAKKTNITFADVKAKTATAEQLAACLSTEEMATLCVGAARINLADVTVVGNFSNSIPGAAGETTPLLGQYGIPSITMVDGPAGIRVNPIVHEKDGGYIKNPMEDPIFKYVLTGEQQAVDLSGSVTKYQYCTALPVATMLAQTWDTALLEEAGAIIGAEMEELGVSLWLAPGMNIQRNPLCGRNFEYFSEDPLLTGLCAAALTKGVQRFAGKGVTIKHLAANNQETNRNFNNSHVSERALREIYLKGYEICVREAKPMAAMTSVNLLNGVHTANDRDLLTSALRDEWGFDGVVMTDWGTTGEPGVSEGQKYGCSSAPGCIKAGNDLIMPGSQRDVEHLLTAVENGELKLEALRLCAARIIKLLVAATCEE